MFTLIPFQRSARWLSILGLSLIALTSPVATQGVQTGTVSGVV